MKNNTLSWWTGVLVTMMAHIVQGEIQPLERIAVKPGIRGAQFVLKNSGTPFFVKGFNYIRLQPGHSTFDASTDSTEAHYEPERAEDMFQTLEKHGYNTVRVFLIGRSPANPGIGGNYETTQGNYEPYMDNVIDFLRRATLHNIRVFPTFGDGGLPRNAYYYDRFETGVKNKNVMILTKEGIDARIEFITSLLSYVKENEPALLPTLLGLQCQNEAYLKADQWPFSETEGEFEAANGKRYDLSDTEERQMLMDDGYRYYHRRVVKAVRVIDPDMLVAEGVFVPRAVGKDPKRDAGLWPGKYKDDRYPPTLTTLGDSPLDFIDVHFYRDNGKETTEQAFEKNLASTGFFSKEMEKIRKKKPVIIGEFGAFDHVEKTFGEAVENMVAVRDLALKANVNGMLFWTYDCLEQERLYHAADDWELFVEKMGTFE